MSKYHKIHSITIVLPNKILNEINNKIIDPLTKKGNIKKVDKLKVIEISMDNIDDPQIKYLDKIDYRKNPPKQRQPRQPKQPKQPKKLSTQELLIQSLPKGDERIIYNIENNIFKVKKEENLKAVKRLLKNIKDEKVSLYDARKIYDNIARKERGSEILYPDVKMDY